MTTQGIVPLKTAQGMNLLQTQSGSANKPQFMPRIINHQQWRNANNLQLLPPSNTPAQDINTPNNTGGG